MAPLQLATLSACLLRSNDGNRFFKSPALQRGFFSGSDPMPNPDWNFVTYRRASSVFWIVVQA